MLHATLITYFTQTYFIIHLVLIVWNYNEVLLFIRYVVAESVNTIKNHLDKFWSNRNFLYDYTADLCGIVNRTIVM